MSCFVQARVSSPSIKATQHHVGLGADEALLDVVNPMVIYVWIHLVLLSWWTISDHATHFSDWGACVEPPIPWQLC